MPMILDGAVLAQMLRSPSGVMGRHLIERATVFQAKAKEQVAGNRKTGCLEDSMVKRVEMIGGEIAIRVISDTSPCSPSRKSYSLFVHEGTAPHVIMPVNGEFLSFYWALGPEGPGQYFFRMVNHPGTAPNRFFSDNLPLFAA